MIVHLGHVDAFDPATVRLLTEAFERAWARLEAAGDGRTREPYAVRARELLAKRIIQIGQLGERDEDVLASDAMTHLNVALRNDAA